MSEQPTLAPEAIELFNAMATALDGKKKKTKKAKAKFVMIVNGNVLPQMIPSKKDAQKAARTITLKTLANGGKEPIIAIAAINEILSIEVPVSGKDVDGIEE
jgi:hypothetical protein